MSSRKRLFGSREYAGRTYVRRMPCPLSLFALQDLSVWQPSFCWSRAACSPPPTPRKNRRRKSALRRSRPAHRIQAGLPLPVTPRPRRRAGPDDHRRPDDNHHRGPHHYHHCRAHDDHRGRPDDHHDVAHHDFGGSRRPHQQHDRLADHHVDRRAPAGGQPYRYGSSRDGDADARQWAAGRVPRFRARHDRSSRSAWRTRGTGGTRRSLAGLWRAPWAAGTCSIRICTAGANSAIALTTTMGSITTLLSALWIPWRISRRICAWVLLRPGVSTDGLTIRGRFRWRMGGVGVPAPWYGYYGDYFAPYPVYPSAAFWLTDYMIAASLQDAYAAQAAAAQQAAARAGGGRPGSGADA